MADNSKIEWTDASWNPLLGCERVSAGCDGCYAIRTARIRASNPHPAVSSAFDGLTGYKRGRLDWTGQVNLLPGRLKEPLAWRKPKRIFVNSQSDLFHKDVPAEYIAKVFAVMLAVPHHTFQVLTKRHARMRSVLSDPWFWSEVAVELGALWKTSPPKPMMFVPPWIWIGVSVENQQWADTRVPALLETPAAVRWISAEPLLGPVRLRPEWLTQPPVPGHCVDADGQRWHDGCQHCGRIEWLVAGGETGPGARPLHPEWLRSLRDECVQAGGLFFVKQHGDYLAVPVLDHPDMFGGRAYKHPDGGYSSPSIREVGPTGTMRTATMRLLEPGERTKRTVMLDRDTIALRVGKKRAGRELDGRTWDQYPPDWRRGQPAADTSALTGVAAKGHG